MVTCLPGTFFLTFQVVPGIPSVKICKIAFRDIFNSVFKVCKWGTTRKLVTRLILVMLHAVGMAQSHFMKHVLWGLGYGARARTPALDRKVPVTQTLSFCQMHFLSPLPVAFDRKLVSVIPVTVSILGFSRARELNPQERRPQEYVWLLVLDSNWLVDRVQPVSNPGLRVTHSWGTSFLLGGLFAERK